MASESHQDTLTFEEGWPVLQEAVDRLIGNIEGGHNCQFTSEEYMRLYTIPFNICQPDPAGPNSQNLYDQYKKIFEDYITSKVLPSLREKKEEILLQELVKRWNNYKLLTRWLSRFFHYLDRYLIIKRELPTLQRTSNLTFYNLVYGEMNDQVIDAVIYLIDQERDGEQIDQALAKNVVDIYVEMGEDSIEYYKKDFEEAMLKNTAEFYSGRAANWITSESYKDYILKVDGCLKHEKDRVFCYLQDSSRYKLLEVLQHELLTVYASKLEEKKLLDDKVA